MNLERRLTLSRLGRLSHLGKLVGGIAGSALSEGARQFARGHRPSVSDLLITPGNAVRIAERLSEMRGAAMKVGQLLSMENGELIPPALSQILSRLRDSAHTMPLGEVANVLSAAWGEGWESGFKQFSFTPLSAASIGQVHDAVLRDGRRLAIKVQYPGIRRSIDSDVDNVGTLLRLFSLIPKEFDFTPLLQVAKRQLHIEADYRKEASFIRQFARHLADDARFEIPQVVESLTTSEVLAMSFLDGRPIEILADMQAPVRNAAGASLLQLALREVFDWGLVQTDPNFANYRFEPAKQRLQLLDFGATREYSALQRTVLRNLLLACLDGNDEDVAHAASTVGYLNDRDSHDYRTGIVSLLRTATEPVREAVHYTFGDSDLARRMSEIALDLRLRDKFGRLPPPEILFLHRKLAGLYMLLGRLHAKIPTRELITPFLEPVDDKACSTDDL